MAMTRNEKTSNFAHGKYNCQNYYQQNKIQYSGSNSTNYIEKDKYSDLSDSRIITKNLVYVIGLSSRIANKEILMKKEYFGQYGTILKMVVNNNKAYNQNNPKGPSYSAYVTYSRPYEASLAILSLDNVLVEDHLIRASFGTTKYCSFYLKKIECTNKDCLFLHKIADKSDIISREDLNGNKNIFLEQQLYAIKIADIFNPEIRKKTQSSIPGKKFKPIFPSPDLIYNKDIVRENDPNLKEGKNGQIVSQNNQFSNNVISKKKKYYEDNNNNFHTVTSSNSSNSHCKSNLNINNSLLSKQKLFLNNQKYTAETTSTSSKEDINYTNLANLSEEKLYGLKEQEKEISLSNNANNKYLLFQNRDTSRFFNLNQQNNNNIKSPPSIEVPTFIQNILLKKAHTYILSRMMKNFKIQDVIYSDKSLKSEYKNKNEWAQFIINQKTNNQSDEHILEEDDKDLIDDFEYINKSVLKKLDNLGN